MRRLIAAIALALVVAGCARERLQYAATGNPSETPNASAAAVPATDAPSSSPTQGGGSPAPAANRTTAGAPPAGTVARPCRMADLRFWLSLALPMQGPYASGSVQMTNTATDRCRVSGYITVRWLDSSGNQMPITVEKLPGTMPGYTSVLQPGKSAHAGLRWTRSRALPSDPEILCPPAPASLEARLSAETTFARIMWSPREGLCDSKAGLQPIEMTP